MRGGADQEEEEADECSEITIIHDIFPPKVNVNL